MTEQEAYNLLKRYKLNQCTEAEEALVDDWFMQLNEKNYTNDNETIKRIAQNISQNLPSSNGQRKTFTIRPILAAAASLFLITLTVLFYFQKPTESIVKENKYDISPGGNKATITLANGKTINLSSSKAGVIITSGKLSYIDGTNIENSADNLDNQRGFQSITTPKGGQYQIELPDGTKVWLNAATTLQFSANLKRERGERKVKLISGEAYFEVFKDKKHPFIVETSQQKIEVLGTHFNVNAYQNLNNTTTLIEGSVKVISENQGQALILRPGQQSDYLGKKLKAKNVDVDLYTAWKNGKLQFEDTDLKTVMDMVARWYNVDVIYQSYPTESRFTGSISRSKNISEVLKLLENTEEVHFKIQGKEVIVMN